MLPPSDITEIICSDRESQRAWKDLCQQLATPTGVTPFVGAGLSIPYGYPGWGAFMVREAPDQVKDEVERMLSAFEYEKAAQLVLNRTSNLHLADAIRHTFGPVHYEAALAGNDTRETVRGGAAEQVPRLTNGPVVTTNYDPVLERVFERANRPFKEVIVGPRAYLTMEALHSDGPVLVKLHGTFNDPQDQILTLNQYDQGYGQPLQIDQDPVPAGNVAALLNQILGQRPLLFLGCSLQQDRIVSQIERTLCMRRGVTHYAVLERPLDSAAFEARKAFLGQKNIRCVWYPYGAHRNLGAILAALATKHSIASPVDDKAKADLVYVDVCMPEESAVSALLASSNNGKAGIVWHRQIRDVIDELVDWRNNFAARVQQFPWVGSPDYANDHLAFRNGILWDYATFVRTELLLFDGLRKILNHTKRAPRQARGTALRSFAGLAALKIISILWTFQKRVWSAQTTPGYILDPVQTQHTFLPAMSCLSLMAFANVDSRFIIPPFCDCTQIAALALPHLDRTYEEFLVCRLSDNKSLKNPNQSHNFTIVLPHTLACQLLRKSSDRITLKKAYYSRILPAWLAMTNRPGIPSLRSVHIFVIEDKNGRDFLGCR